MLSTYTKLLNVPGAWQFSAAGFLARMPIAMNALGILLLVSMTTGSYAFAGVVSGCYTLAAAVASPFSSRLVDRFGQSRVLLPVGLADAAFMIVLAFTVIWQLPSAVIVVAALVAGTAHPNIGSMVRARWVALLGSDPRLRTAFAWESVLDEFIFTLGPIVTTFLAISVAPASPLFVAAVLTAFGALLLVAQKRTEPVRSIADHHERPRGALRHRGMLIMIIAAIGLGGLFGAYEVSVVAFTAEHSSENLAGWILALWAGGSMLAGLVFGIRHPAMPFGKLLPICTGLAFAMATLAPFAPNTAVLACLAFFGGLTVAPSLIVLFGLAEALVPEVRLTEGLTLANSGIALGFALGTALAGNVIDRFSASSGFWIAAAAIGVAFIASLVGMSRTLTSSSIGP